MEALPGKILAAQRVILVIILFVVFLFFLSNVGNSTEPSGETVQEQDLFLTWSANHGQGEQVYFSRYSDESWSAPVQVSDSADYVLKPVSSTGNDGKVWVVWSKQNAQGSFLMFCQFSSGWSPPRMIHTGMDNNRAVTVVVDRENTPWVAWTGVDDSYSDIFWSRWNGQSWSKPVKGHDANEVPDIEPRLALDAHGDLFFSWKTYANGRYRTVVKKWDGRLWQLVTGVMDEDEKGKMRLNGDAIPPLPEFIREPHKTSLFIKNKKGAEAIPLKRL